jgi:vacuolar-type H+-ATPase subunit E/Vma4
MRAWGSAAAVAAAVRDDASAERERLERETAAALDGLTRSIAAPSAAVASSAGGDRLEVVRRAAGEAEAAEDWEDTVSAASDRDAWITAVAAEGRRAIATGPAARAWLERVTREAVAELPGDACVVTIPATQLADAERWCGSVGADLEKSIRLEAGNISAGCIARTPDGRVTFDNTVEARERRARTEWRTAIACLYDEAVAAQPAGAA